MTKKRLAFALAAVALGSSTAAFWTVLRGGSGPVPRATQAWPRATPPPRPSAPRPAPPPDSPRPAAAARLEAPQDPFAGAPVVASRESAPRPDGTIERVRVLRTGFKYPLVRVVETVRPGPAREVEEILRRVEMVADHVIVRLRRGVKEEDLKAAAARHGAGIRRKRYAPDTYLVGLESADPEAVPRAVAALSGEGAAAYAEPDYIVRAIGTVPNDPRFAELYGLHNTGQTGGTPDADIDAVEAWDVSRGSSAVRVGVIDTGIEYTHEDLAANIWVNPFEIAGNGLDDDSNGFIDDVRGWDFINDDNNPIDDHFHGTHVAGTIGAVGNNGKGVAGVCWTVTLVPLKFLGSGGSGTISDAVDATYYATRLGCHLTSNSWGGGGYSQAMADALADADLNGVLFVAAAGNSSSNNDLSPHYPSSYGNPNVIAVAALDHNDLMATFSSYGATSVDLGAPGVNTLSCNLNNSYRLASGTSMATPHVSGVCALLKAVSPSLTHAGLKARLLATVDPLPALSGKCVSGGRVNALRALLPSVTGPFLLYNRHALDDDASGASSGNGDGLASPGERVEVQVTIRNAGQSPAAGVTAALSLAAPDPKVTIVQGSAAYGTVPSGAEATQPFVVQFASDLPTPRTLTFNLQLADSGAGSWADSFSFTVYSASRVAGRVTDLGTGLPIGGATIEFAGPLSGSRPTAADGTYSFGAIGGTYLVVARKPGLYVDSSPRSVTVPPDALNVDFQLGRPDLAVSPSSFAVTAVRGDLPTRILTLQNVGSQALNYTLAATVSGGLAAGDAMRWLTPGSQVGWLFDAAWDGSGVWVTHGPYSPTLHKIHPESGQILGQLDLTGVVQSPWGLCWDGSRFWVTDRWNNRIYCIDPATGQALKNFTGPDPVAGPQGIEVIDGVVYVLVVKQDAYLGGYRYAFLNTLYKLSSADGSVQSQINIPQASVTGILSNFAYAAGALWFPTGSDFDRPGTSRTYKVHPQDGRVLGSIPQPTLQTLGAADAGQGSLWGTDGSLLDRYSTGEGGWLRFSPSSGTVPPGGSTGVTLTFDSLEPGLGSHSGTIRVASNDPGEPELSLPVSFTVNTGSHAPVAQNQSVSTPRNTPADVRLSATDTEVDPLSYSIVANPLNGTLAPVSVSGTVWTWGINGRGQLGDGTTVERFVPKPVPALSGTVAVSSGGAYTLALISDGTLVGWGVNGSGQLGDGSLSDRLTPVPVAGISSVTRVLAGHNTSFAITSDGRLWAWGDNYWGLLGDGTTTNRGTPAPLAALTGVVGVAGGESHAVALKSDGTVWTWGRNLYGALGAPNAVSNRLTPEQVGGLSGITAIGAGNYHGLAVKSDGTVWAWGYNEGGALGDGSLVNQYAPVQAVGVAGAVQVAGGASHSLALLSDSRVWAWGRNDYGQLGDNTVTRRTTPRLVPNFDRVTFLSAYGDSSMALGPGGTLWTWGLNSSDFNSQEGLPGGFRSDPRTPQYAPTRIEGLDGVTSMGHGGAFTSVALSSSSALWRYTPAVGFTGTDSFTFRASDGTLASNTATVSITVTPTNVTPVIVSPLAASATVGSPFKYAILATGDAPITYGATGLPAGLYFVRDTIYGVPEQAAASSISISATNGSGSDAKTLTLTVVARSNAALLAWGQNFSGQLGDGSTTVRSTPVSVLNLSNVASFSAGRSHSLAALTDGTVWSWGGNLSGQLGDGTTANRNAPGPVTGLGSPKALSGGEAHSLALRSDGTVAAWGDNSSGQLGDGTLVSKTTPVSVSGLTGVRSISAGNWFNLALRTDGTVRAWGYGGDGQLGNGTWSNSSTPVQPTGLTQVVAASAGQRHSLALKSDGTVWAWGDNVFGQLGDGGAIGSVNTPRQVPGFTGVVAIAAGRLHNLALKSDGTLWAWGENSSGQLGDYTITTRKTPVQVRDISGVLALSGGFRSSLALRSDGTVWAWGRNDAGQLGEGTLVDRRAPVRVSGLTGAVAIATQDNHTLALQFQYTISGRVTHNGQGLAGAGVTDGARTAIADAAGNYVLRGVPNGSFSLSAVKPGYVLLPSGWANPVTVAFGDQVRDFVASVAVAITSPLEATARVGQPFRYTIAASGDAPITYNATASSGLPPGISFSGNTITGTPTQPGAHAITITATNSVGEDTKTLALSIQEAGGPTNQAPIIAAGPTVGPNPVLLPGKALLGVVASDPDGPAPLTYTWSRESGPGEVTFAPNASSTTSGTTASFSAAGAYLLRVRVSDGALDATGTVSVTVNPRPAGGIAKAWGHNSSGQLGDGTTDGDPGFTGRSTPAPIVNLFEAVALRGGGTHCLALKPDGTVWAWGSNLSGQLGDGTTTNRTTRVQVSGLTGIVDVACGGGHSLALRSDGTVWSWGSNSLGQLGLGSGFSGSTTPARVALPNVVAIGAGVNHSFAVQIDGTLWAWGSNSDRQLGDGTTLTRYLPVPVSGLPPVLAAGGGQGHSLALAADGSVWAWGTNATGQLGDGTTTPRAFPVPVSGLPQASTSQLAGASAVAAGSSHSLALLADGTVLGWGWNGEGQLGDGTTTTRLTPVRVQGLSGVSEIAAGSGHGLALRSDRTIRTWGYNGFGQLGDASMVNRLLPVQVVGITDATLIGAGQQHSLALTGDGSPPNAAPVAQGQSVTTSQEVSKAITLVATDADGNPLTYSIVATPAQGVLYGTTADRTYVPNPGFSGTDSFTFKANDGRVDSNLATVTVTVTAAVPTAEALWAWGDNWAGQVGDGTVTSRPSPVRVYGLRDVTSLSAGGSHSLAVRADGTVWGWGENLWGQVGDGTLVAKYVPVRISGLTQVSAIAAGDGRSVALRNDGTVWGWGLSYGLPTDTTSTVHLLPVQVSGLSGAVGIEAGGQHALAVRSDGTVWAWGRNGMGQLGDGTTTDRMTPVQVAGLTGAVAVAAGAWHSLALKSDGTLVAWGGNTQGQMGDGTTATRTTPVAVAGLTGVTRVSAGAEHSLAVRSDGTVWTWGYNNAGQLGDGTTTGRTSPVQVAGLSGVSTGDAGGHHSMAVKSDGTAWAWGYNGGVLGDGTTTHRYTPVQIAAVSGITVLSTGSSVTLALKPAPASSAPFQQDTGADGIVAIEVEHYHAKAAQGGHDWTPNATAGYSGDGALDSTPNNGANVNTGYSAGSPRLDFQVNFVRTGAHTVWIRGIGPTGSDDSCHVGLDGAELASSDRISTFGTGWTWSNSTMDAAVATFNVAAAGVHTVNLWMREDGFIADKILLTTNSAYAPTGTGPVESPRVNAPPSASITSPANGAAFTAPASITIAATASDADGSVTKVEFFQGATKLGEDTTSPYGFTWTGVAAGAYTLTATATDNGGEQTTSAAVSVTVNAPPTGSGTVLREYWTGIAGTAVADLTANPAYPNSPTGSDQPAIFEGPVNWADNYGTRFRGYVHPPVTGSYVFWISGDDGCELWLSTNDTPANRALIATVPGWTNSREWTKFPQQQSAAIALVAGQKYFVEALQKEGGGGDNVAVGWQLPDATQERPVPGGRLSPFVPAPVPVVTIAVTDASAAEAGADIGRFTVTRTGDTSAPLTVNLALGGTATNGSDYSSLSTTAAIPGGQASTTITVTPIDDAAVEGSETVIVTIAGGTGYGVGSPSSGTVTIADNDAPAGPQALFVVLNSAALNAAEQQVQARLQGLGYTVTARSATAAVTGDATGKALIVVSSTVNSADVNTKFRTSAVPAIVWESALHDDFGMTGLTSGTDYGSTTGQTALSIVNPSHPLAAGLSGTPTVMNAADTFTWGVPNANAIKAANLSADATKCVIFGYEAGSAMPGLAAPARRVGFFFQDNAAANANASGLALFDAAVRWAANTSPTVSITSPANGATFTAPASITIDATASDANGTVTKVEFFQGAAKLGEDTTSPYSFAWTGVAAGSYSLTARATDNVGDGTASAAVSVTVSAAALPTVTIAANDASASEAGPDQGQLTITRTGSTASPLTVTIAIGGTATNGTDYNSLSTTATIPGGQASSTVTIAPIDDAAVEGSETVTVTVAAGGVYTVGSPSNGTVTIADNDSAPKTALLVVGAVPLAQGDPAVQTRLQNLGYTVTAKDAVSAVTADATGKTIVVVSSTVASGNVNTKFRTVAVPVLNWESALMDDFGMTGTVSGTDFGTEATQTTLSIVNTSHPMAAGLTGAPTVVTTASTFTWGVPNANAVKIATVNGNATRAVIFGYLAGAAMPGLAAPARRVGLFLENATASSLNASGWALFDAAVNWAVGTGATSLGTLSSDITLNGQGSYATVQEAIDAALPGDTVQLGAMTFFVPGGLALKGGVSIRGAGPHRTILDGQGAAAVLRLSGTAAEGPSTVDLLTVTGGATGIDTGAADARLRNLQVVRNTGDGIVTGQTGAVTGLSLTVADNGGDGIEANNPQARFRGLILARNGGRGVNAVAGVTVGYSTLFGNTLGTDNYAGTIAFRNAAALDYREAAGSASVDAGDPADPFDLEPAPNGGRANQGAFGNTPEATASPR